VIGVNGRREKANSSNEKPLSRRVKHVFVPGQCVKEKRKELLQRISEAGLGSRPLFVSQLRQ